MVHAGIILEPFCHISSSSTKVCLNTGKRHLSHMYIYLKTGSALDTSQVDVILWVSFGVEMEDSEYLVHHLPVVRQLVPVVPQVCLPRVAVGCLSETVLPLTLVGGWVSNI